MLSREWRCIWSSADRRCSNYIWVIDNFIAYKGAAYIRDFTVSHYNYAQDLHMKVKILTHRRLKIKKGLQLQTMSLQKQDIVSNYQSGACQSFTIKYPGPCLNIKSFPGMGIPMLKIRQSWDCLIFFMGIPIMVRRHLYTETAPKTGIDNIFSWV